MYSEVKKEVAKLLAEAAKVSEEEALASLEMPKGAQADLACTLAFSLAKKEKKNPMEFAKLIAQAVEDNRYIEKVEAMGPYVNFFFSKLAYQTLLQQVFHSHVCYGKAAKGKKKALVEFPSVNPNKPWHIGHLRNAVLGDCVARVLDWNGYTVEREDYIDDLGLQVAQSLWGTMNLHAEQGTKKFDLWLGEQYVEVAKKMEDKAIETQVRSLIEEMEAGEGETARNGRELAEKCVAAQYETAANYGIVHDVLIFESDIAREIFDEGIEQLKKSDIIVKESEGKNAGCLVARMTGKDFEGMESADKILIRSDGTATYTGKDVVFQLWKFGKLQGKFKYKEFIKQDDRFAYASAKDGKEMPFGKADIVVNVIGSEQIYPQKVIAEIFRALGYEKEANNCIHLAYEHVTLEDAKFSGRKGTWVGFTADELLEEGIKKASEKVKEEMTASDCLDVSKAVASGAIRFAMVRTSPEKRIVFKWESVLSMEGDSAPYIMYAQTRASSVLRKAKDAGIEHGDERYAFDYDYNDDERKLLKLVGLFPDVVLRAGSECRPHHIAEYMLDLSTTFNKFYNAYPVIKAESAEAAEARLAIVKAARITLRNGMELLGIEAIERM